MSKNFIPTMVNLAKRKLCNNPVCLSCQRDAETIEHVFWFCPAAIEVWKLINLQWILGSSIINWWDWAYVGSHG